MQFKMGYSCKKGPGCLNEFTHPFTHKYYSVLAMWG